MYKYQKLLESLRLKRRVDIKTAFEDDDDHTDLNFESFYDIIQSKLCLKVSLKDAQILFHQIDAYSKGKIKYKNLASYLEKYEERRLAKDGGLYESIPSIHQGVRSQDSIFEWTIYEELENSVDEVAGHFVSLSRNGVLTFWRRDMTKNFETKIAVLDDGDKMTTMATGLACLPRYKMVAVATTAADIRFFRSRSYR
ncbi:uncharacterized protein NPIL_553041 [Nephila pilipes]|uniref:Uncharacterized protein n=1 Tax=Nephila pilipes TaxID=299642 RepID=A0A8X6N1G5_NEPPI|nr:uncharacterized protein NPIL_553041 [Nephila pilipes]